MSDRTSPRRYSLLDYDERIEADRLGYEGSASQGKKLARVLPVWREQVARVIAEATVEPDVFCGMCGGMGMDDDSTPGACNVCAGSGDGRDAKRIALLGMHEPFDVALVRAHAERMVAMVRHRGVHVVVSDYRRSIGRPPRLAWSAMPHDAPDGDVALQARQIWHEDAGLPPGLPHNAMNWQGIARVGQRVLDMLDGRCAWAPSAERQPSECQACVSKSDTAVSILMRASDDGPPALYLSRKQEERLSRTRYMAGMDLSVLDHLRNVGFDFKLGPCPDCHDTGHNLRGVLPPIEWPACALPFVPGTDERRAMLQYRERELGIVPVDGQTLEDRRAVVLARSGGVRVFQPLRVQRIEGLADEFDNADASLGLPRGHR